MRRFPFLSTVVLPVLVSVLQPVTLSAEPLRGASGEMILGLGSLGHTDLVSSVAFSPDGTKVLTGSRDKTAKLWDAGTGEPIRTFSGHTDYVESVAFSPDGTKVLTGSGDKTAKLWDAGTGLVIRTFSGHTSSVTSVAFSPDGTKVLTKSYPDAKLWDAGTGQEIRTFSGHTYVVRSVAFSPDGTKVLTGSYAYAKLWDAGTGQEIRTFSGHTDWVRSVAFSPDGTKVLTGSDDKTAKLWDAGTGEVIRTFSGHTGSVGSVAFSPDGTKVLTGGSYDTARLWDAGTGGVIRTFSGDTSEVYSVAFSPDGTKVLTGGSYDKTAKLWDAGTGQVIRTFSGHTSSINSVAFSPDGTKVLTGGDIYTAMLWDVGTGQEIRTFSGHASSVNSVAFSPDGTKVLTGAGYDTRAKLWDAGTGQEIRTFSGHFTYVYSVAFSPDGTKVLTGGWDSKAKLSEAGTGQEIRTFSGHTGEVLSVAFSPDGTKVLTGSGDKTAKLWDAGTGQEIRTFSAHTDWVWSVAYSPDGTKVLTGSFDKTAKLWDAGTGQEIRTFSRHTDRVSSVAFSPDGTKVLTGSYDKTAKLWDAGTGAVIRTFSGHTDQVNSVAFSPDGTKVLTGSEDYTARIWYLIPVISGTVTDFSTVRPIPSVTLTTNSGASVQSDSAGQFAFYGLNSGVYDITITKTGYQTITIRNVVVMENQTTKLDVVLNSPGFLNITTTSLPSAEAEVEYNARVRITGGVYPYVFSVVWGQLPPGLVLESETGNLSGVPTATGSYTFSVGVTDSQAAYAEQEYTVVVTEQLLLVSISPLPRGTRGTNYFLSFEAMGGTLPYSFSRSSGSLPSGLTLNSAGNLTGTPTSAGVSSFTVRVTDNAGRTAEKQFSIEIVDPPAISTGRLDDGTVGQVYNQTLAASGGYGTKQWEVYSGILPAGLQLDRASGALTGTPLSETYGTIVFAISDDDGRIAFQDFALRICEPLAILTTALPDGLRDETYSEMIRVQGGIEPFSFQMTGQLSDGLTLNTSSGVVSGIPTASQFKNFSITVVDSRYPSTQSDTEVLSLRTSSRLTILSPAVLPNGKKGVPVNTVVLTARGGPSPYSWFRIGGYLPDGITLNEQNGELSGTPTARGDYVFTIQATDAASGTAQKEFFWHISDDLTITSTAIPDAAKDTRYNTALEAKGGIPSYTWRVKSGTLPSGLSFNGSTGLISGVPTTRQTFSFTIEVNDSDSPAQTTQQTYILQVLDTLFISTACLPNGRADEGYTATIRAELGNPPYQWRLESGVLPSGLDLVLSSVSARLEGTPTTPGTYTFALEVSDTGTPVQKRTREYTVEVYGHVSIDTVGLKSALVGVPYSDYVVASGGELPYAWRIVDGALPKGLSLNPSTGHISGLATLGVGQSSTCKVRVTDSGFPSGFDEREFTIFVIDGIEITTQTIQKALQFAAYRAELEGQGGISPYHWSITAGRLPNGIDLDPNTGVIAGTAQESGVFDFTIQMTDSSQPEESTTRAFALEVLGAPTPTPTRIPTVTPTATMTQVPTDTPVPPTATPLPTDTPVPTPSDTPVPTPLYRITFDESSPEEAGFFTTAAGGMQPAQIQIGEVPPGEGTDGRGLIINAAPGQGTLSIQTTPISVGPGPKLFTVNVMADSPGASAALAVLNAPMGVDMGFVQASGPDVPVGEWGRLVLIYDPPDDAVHLGVQVALDGTAQSGVTVYYDNLTIRALSELSHEPVTLDANGSFDGDNASVFPNVNQNRGSMEFLPDIQGGKNVLLSIRSSDDAANVGIFASQLQSGFPHIVQASVDARRLSGSGGVIALVMTNGYGNVGTFVSGDKLPTIGSTPMTITIGGGFTTENASFPIINVVQNGSTGTASAIIVDNLEVKRVTGGL